ncbi:hypothetical protein [Paenibacillus sp. FSL H8-0537]|uniref:hypothetical protein n=1 Tax=Paenibacillus sp. FSL H8-0537 TaxID=2921399 RepID=UPI003100B981
MDSIYQRLVQLNDQLVTQSLGLQIKDSESRNVGGIIDSFTGLPHPSHVGTGAVIAKWTAALCSPESAFYRDKQLLASLELALQYMLNRQHSDGTITLGSTNYHSPPDTGFVVIGFAQLYELLEQQSVEYPAFEKAVSLLALFLKRATPAMLEGGCHTPNHRWILTAALGLLNKSFPDPALVARANAWLAEGIDITADGEWTERSNGIYNAVSDIALYHTALSLDRPELLESVRSNLRMMQYLVHPSGEVVTDYSGRQDYGQPSDMSGYFLPYRLMASYDRDPLFAALSDYAGPFFKQFFSVTDHPLIGYLLYPEQMDISHLERAALSDRYVKIINGQHPIHEDLQEMKKQGHQLHITHSSAHTAFGAPLVRVRDGQTSATVMTSAPSFFSLRHGSASLLAVKVSTAFTPGVVSFDQFQAEDGHYKLGKRMYKGYNGPIPSHLLPKLEADGVTADAPWYLLPHGERERTHLQEHFIESELTQTADGWDIRLHSDKLQEDVMTQLTFVFAKDGKLSGEGLEAIAGSSNYFLKQGSCRYETSDGSAIELTSGAFEHWMPSVRDDSHPAGCQSVIVNLLSPVDNRFSIRLSS